MKIAFVRDEIVRDPSTGKVIRAFKAGEIVETSDEVAAHWVNLGAAAAAPDGAVAAPAPASAPEAPLEETPAVAPMHTRRMRG